MIALNAILLPTIHIKCQFLGDGLFLQLGIVRLPGKCVLLYADIVLTAQDRVLYLMQISEGCHPRYKFTLIVKTSRQIVWLQFDNIDSKMEWYEVIIICIQKS